MAATPRKRRSAVAPSVAEAMDAGFTQHLTKIRQIFSLHQSCACADTLRTTGDLPRVSFLQMKACDSEQQWILMVGAADIRRAA